MRIKVISDTHNEHEAYGEMHDLSCDVLIHCGDAGTRGNYTEIENFLTWFVKQPARYKIFVPGNHDKRFKTHKDLQAMASRFGIYYAIDSRAFILEGVQFYLNTYVPQFSREHGLHRNPCTVDPYQDAPSYPDIVVTHAPPREILDRNQAGSPCGCFYLARYMRDISSKTCVHLFGHIHEERGKQILSSGKLHINCAVMTRSYELDKAPFEMSYYR